MTIPRNFVLNSTLLFNFLKKMFNLFYYNFMHHRISNNKLHHKILATN